MNAKLKDLKSVSKPLKEALDNAVKYTVGNDSKIKEYEFDKVKSL